MVTLRSELRSPLRVFEVKGASHMSYLVLARKHRPSTFDEVIGQEHITELLKKAIAAKRIAHAYLFCGPRGIGKTSCARILAKALNCQDGPTVNPCGKCPSCLEIAKGSSFDVLEIDGASNRGIDEVRVLRENVKFAPAYGAYKIYIVDEVHMLTTEAFNALLKTLEEPPPHVKFIFATTDPNKVPATIISRCQRYDFKRVPVKVIIEALSQICQKEKFSVTPEALYAIARAAQGSLRDALSILDQVSALSDRQIKNDDVCSMLGLVELEFLFNLVEAIADKDCAAALKVLDDIIDKGKDIKQLGRDLLEHLRNLMIVKTGGKSLGRLIDYPVNVKDMYLTQSGKLSLGEILKAVDIIIEAQETSRITESLRIPLEIAIAKLTFNAEAAKEARPFPKKETLKPAIAAEKAPAMGILGNEKGSIRIEPSAEPPREAPLEQSSSPAEISLETIKRAWEAITYAVSREKMSIATYLQEGAPYELKIEAHGVAKLTVGFAKEFEFHKETLEQKEYVFLVEKILAEKLKTKLILRYKIIEDVSSPVLKEEEPLVKNALETFKGKIVSQWHKE